MTDLVTAPIRIGIVGILTDRIITGKPKCTYRRIWKRYFYRGGVKTLYNEV